ncbi:MAG TPA: hypothetical protein VK501_20520 [Baekduia sp.]|uniref:hypothetical protein n=1 Tax=Baekduia sp. TaxID=2600305 RepID=UPI002CF80B41|nr:hypothetical protein [Baekduia sp.]HMJ36298.1 hypothetical protein [Baekduia sp.]
MTSRFSRALACVAVSSTLGLGVILGLTACGGSTASAKSATDAASGLTVTVTDDQVSLKRSAKSTSGTGGTSGTVSCTDDYSKLVKASAVPAPSQAWYATTLITWPAAAKESTATLSHKLAGDPQLCVVETADSSAQAIIYFGAKVKSGVAKLQTDTARGQQAAQATAALKSAAQTAVSGVAKGAFPAATSIVETITGQGLVTKQAATVQGVSETGTVYVVADQSSAKKLVLALKDAKGTVHTATQGVKGSPKLGTATP